MNMTKITLALCAATLFTSAAFADTPAQKASDARMQVDTQRAANQQQRIQNGVENGSLTTREAARLEAGQARTSRKIANAAADGHVGPAEQARIQRSQNRQSANVYRKKHNGRAK